MNWLVNCMPWTVFVAVGIGGAVLGTTGTSLYYRAEIARIEADQDKAVVAAYQAQADRTRMASERADVLSTRLAETEQALTSKILEVSREIPRVTSGRPCLGPGAVRLLNRPVGTDPAAVPTPAGPPAAEGGPIATDTDVAGWIAGAQQHYDTCRARLGALIDFEEDAQK